MATQLGFEGDKGRIALSSTIAESAASTHFAWRSCGGSWSKSMVSRIGSSLRHRMGWIGWWANSNYLATEVFGHCGCCHSSPVVWACLSDLMPYAARMICLAHDERISIESLCQTHSRGHPFLIKWLARTLSQTQRGG